MAYSNLSFVRHVGDGTKTMFPLTVAGENMGYFRTEDIHTYVNDAEVPNVIQPQSPHIVNITPAPAVGSDVLIRREMPVKEPYSDFSRGNNFGHRQVNNTFLQQLYLTHEILDGFLPKGFYMKQDISMGGNTVNDVGDGRLQGDAVNLKQLSELDARHTGWNVLQDNRISNLEKTTGKLLHSTYLNILDFGGDNTNTRDNSTALELAQEAGVAIYFPDGVYRFDKAVMFTKTANIFTNGEVTIMWNGGDLADWAGLGMWDTSSLTVGFNVIGNFKFNHTGSGLFKGCYIRMNKLGGYFEKVKMYNSDYTIMRNSSRTSNGQGSSGSVVCVDCEFINVGNGVISYGFYPWWDDTLNTTELTLVRCKTVSKTRQYVAEYVGKVSIEDCTFMTMDGVCYQQNANDWDKESRWKASSDSVVRLDNTITTSPDSGGSLQIDLIDLGFSIGDSGYFLLECSLVNRTPNTNRPPSSANVNGVNFKSVLYDNTMAKFEVTDNGSGGATLSIVIGANGELRMRDLVIFKENNNTSYIAHGNYYNLRNNRYLGCQWGMCVGIDGRRIHVHDNLVIGAKRPCNIDTVSYPNPGGEALEYPRPDAFGLVTGNTFIACYDQFYVTGGNIQVKDNLFQSCGHLAPRAIINVNSQDRQAPQVADDFSYSTDVLIADNNFINVKSRLGYISGRGRMLIGDGNSHDAPLFDYTLWGAERNSEDDKQKSMVMFTNNGYKGIRKVTESISTLDMYDDFIVVDSKVDGTLSLGLPTDSYGRGNGCTLRIINVSEPSKAIQLRVLNGFNTLNGGGSINFPSGAISATLTCISDNNDYFVTFDFASQDAPREESRVSTLVPTLLTPRYVGDEYMRDDTQGNNWIWYKAVGISKGDWIEIGKQPKA